ncbi:MAG: hypothetical protein N3I86_04255 [Verrucomicrobiae bacterium]|nr:hypothetical protein [Verrucomicrobiae bacterium]
MRINHRRFEPFLALLQSRERHRLRAARGEHWAGQRALVASARPHSIPAVEHPDRGARREAGARACAGQAA